MFILLKVTIMATYFKIGLFVFFLIIQLTVFSQIDMRSGYTGPIFANRNPEVIFYPNPVVNDLYVQFPYEVQQMEITMYSYMGEKVIKMNYYDSYLLELDMRNLPQGVYFIHVVTSDEIFLRQIYKEN